MVAIKITTITIAAIITIAIPTIAPVESSSDDSLVFTVGVIDGLLEVVGVTVGLTAKQYRE